MSVVHKLLKEWEKNQIRPSSSKVRRRRGKNKKKNTTRTKAGRLAHQTKRNPKKKDWDFTNQDLNIHKLNQEELLNKKASLQSKHRESGPVLVKESRKTFANKSRKEKQNRKQQLHNKWQKRLTKKKGKRNKPKGEPKDEYYSQNGSVEENNKKRGERNNRRMRRKNQIQKVQDEDTEDNELEKNYQALKRKNGDFEKEVREQQRENETNNIDKLKHKKNIAVPCAMSSLLEHARHSLDTNEGTWDWDANTSCEKGMDFLDDKLDSLQKEFYQFENKVKEKLKRPIETKEITEIPANENINVSSHSRTNIGSGLKAIPHQNSLINYEHSNLEKIVKLQQERISSMGSKMNIIVSQIQTLANQVKVLQRQNQNDISSIPISSNTITSSFPYTKYSDQHSSDIAFPSSPTEVAAAATATLSSIGNSEANLSRPTTAAAVNSLGMTTNVITSPSLRNPPPLGSTVFSPHSHKQQQLHTGLYSRTPTGLNQFATPSLEHPIFTPMSTFNMNIPGATSFGNFQQSSSSRLTDYGINSQYVPKLDQYVPVTSAASLNKPNDLLNRTFIPSDPLIFNYPYESKAKAQKIYDQIILETNHNSQALSSTLSGRKFHNYEDHTMVRTSPNHCFPDSTSRKQFLV